MDQKELQEKIALYYSKLPPEAQKVFSSMTWLETLKTISQKYSLNDKQIEILGTETTLVLLGIIHLVEYEEIFTNELGLSENIAEKILNEIEESIIKPIRPQLITAFNENKKVEADEQPEVGQKLDKRFEKLPKEIENIVEKSNYRAILYAITKGYNLTVTQMNILETAVDNLTVGIIHPDEFENYLESNLKLPSEIVRKIVNDINEEIFLKIRGLLKNTGQNISQERDKNGEKDTQVLNSAGIEIAPGKLELTNGEKSTENREEMIKKIEEPETIEKITNYELRINNKEETHPILTQKLSSSTQTSVVKTDHSLKNLSSNSTSDAVSKSKVDPYRELPE